MTKFNMVVISWEFFENSSNIIFTIVNSDFISENFKKFFEVDISRLIIIQIIKKFIKELLIRVNSYGFQGLFKLFWVNIPVATHIKNVKSLFVELDLLKC